MRSKALGALLALTAGLVTLGGPAAAAVPAYAPYEAFAVKSRAASVAIGDVNGDGRQDVVLTTSYSGDAEHDFSLFVFTQSSTGTLGPFTRYDTLGRDDDPMAVAAGDLNGDRFADVVLATSGGVQVRYGSANGLGAEAYVTSSRAHHVEIADLDGTWPPEIVTSGPSGVSALWRSTDTGYWWPMPVHSTVATELEVGDVTGDGRADIVGFQGPTVYVFAQVAGPGFAEPRMYSATLDPYWPDAGGLAVGDLDADGRNDVALSSSGYASAAAVNLFFQTESGELGSPRVYDAYAGPEPLEIADLDGDGRSELAMAHAEGMRLGVWWSAGPRELFEIPHASHYRWTALALGDVNGDRFGDLVLAGGENGLVVLRSSPPGTDTDPPDTTIVGGPTGSTWDSTVTFSFVADEPDSTFRCSLSGSAFAPCSSPQTYPRLADRPYEFRVVATDAVGNVDPTPAARPFTVDTRAPETSITGGPSGTLTSTTATFSFSSDEPDPKFGCSIDGGAVFRCTSPHTFTGLADGAHEFGVAAGDAALNVDPTPARRTFTVERPSDLAVALSAAPDPVKAKGQLTYTVRVTNSGPADSGAVTVTHILPVQATVVSITPSAGSCSPGSSPATVTCSLGALPAGSAATVGVVVKVNAKHGAVLTSEARVSGPRFDPNTANNAASVSTTVR